MSKIVRELDNYFDVIRDLATEADEWQSRPSWLEFAPNNVCNLRCIMCAQSDGLPVVAMKRDEARALLGQVLPWITVWTPSALSEPLLADFRMVLEECRKHDVFLNMYTNATLTTGEKFREMADRLHKLYISFDSHVPEVFERLRAKADFESVLANVKEILAAAAELQIPVGFVVVLMRDTVRTLPEYIDFIADIGGTAARVDVRAQSLLGNTDECRELSFESSMTDAEVCEFLDRAGERAVARGINFHIEGREPFYRNVSTVQPFMRWVTADIQSQLIANVQKNFPGFCYMAAMYMKIEPDGRVFPCCRGPEELLMGNVRENTIEEIWNGETYRTLRQRMRAGDYPEPCKGCDILEANPNFHKPE
ncbi:MAG: SPASM domain-containing protein [Planctomycetes bacterium]|nr:SPASM domain-containing protein [Planctomycetota bacterium]